MKIYGPNYICLFELVMPRIHSFIGRKKKNIKMNSPLLDLSALSQVKILYTTLQNLVAVRRKTEAVLCLLLTDPFGAGFDIAISTMNLQSKRCKNKCVKKLLT